MTATRRELPLLLAAASFLFTANPGLSLPSLTPARQRSRLLVVDKDRLGEIQSITGFERVLEWGDAVLVRIHSGEGAGDQSGPGC